MKRMSIKGWVRKAISTASIVALVTTYSMVTLAASNKPVGELLVTGDSVTDTVSVTVNGEAAKTGRTIFSSSAIVTPDTLGATVNLGKAGKLELAPNTSFTLNVDGDTVSGDLATGSLTVLSSAQPVNVKTSTGETVAVNVGETATATPAGITKNAAKKGPGGMSWLAFGSIVAAVVVAVVIIAVVTNNDDSTPTSPVR